MAHRTSRIALAAIVCLAAATSAGPTVAGAQDHFAADPGAAPSARVLLPGPAPPEAVRLSRDLVTVAVSVSDRHGRLISGLESSHFEVFDDKVKQSIEFFAADDEPVTIGIVYDVSGSMKNKVARSLYALRRFAETCHRDDEFFLVGFNRRPQLLKDFTTGDASFANSLMLLEPDGPTALYDATYLAIEKVRQGRHARRALLIVSDGQDNNSRYTSREIRELLKESDVIVYGIGIVNPSDEYAYQGQRALEGLCKVTGGRTFCPGTEDALAAACTTVALELRSQYSIGFYPAKSIRDGRWHRLDVRVTPPEGFRRVAARAREGYYGLKP